MTPKERILGILNRQPVDRLPVDLWHTPEIAAALRSHFKVADDFAMWRALGLDKIVWDFMDYRTDAGERAGGQSGAGAESGGARTMWGVPLQEIQAGDARYAQEGFICASCHNVQPGTPLENIFTMVETVHQSGNQMS